MGSGVIKGVGEALAKRIVKKFKLDTFRIIEEEPERLAEVKGISLKKAMDIAIQFQEKQEMRHFRVDKMREVFVTDKKRKGKAAFNKQDKVKYNEQYFRMFGGEVETVSLRCRNEMANVIIDQFGRDAWMHPIDNEWFTASVNVAVSDQFLGWIVALGGKVVITGPESAKERMKELVGKKFVE